MACDDHYQVFRLLQPNYVMGGWVAKLAPQAHGTLLLFFRHILFSLLVGFELRPSNCGGSQRAAKFAAMQTALTFTLHFTLSGQVLTILHTKPENGL